MLQSFVQTLDRQYCHVGEGLLLGGHHPGPEPGHVLAHACAPVAGQVAPGQLLGQGQVAQAIGQALDLCARRPALYSDTVSAICTPAGFDAARAPSLFTSEGKPPVRRPAAPAPLICKN